jgi:hypothetical protein
MADKFTKTEEPAGLEEDDWKDVPVAKEHQPEKQISNRNYRDMEEELADIEKDITWFGERKTALEAEMLKVKTAAQA